MNVFKKCTQQKRLEGIILGLGRRIPPYLISEANIFPEKRKFQNEILFRVVRRKVTLRLKHDMFAFHTLVRHQYVLFKGIFMFGSHGSDIWMVN